MFVSFRYDSAAWKEKRENAWILQKRKWNRQDLKKLRNISELILLMKSIVNSEYHEIRNEKKQLNYKNQVGSLGHEKRLKLMREYSKESEEFV